MVKKHMTWPRVIGLAVAIVVLGALGLMWWMNIHRAPPVLVAQDVYDRARSAAQTLRVVDPLPLDDYDRAFFGTAWQRLEAHPCDTRNEVLQSWLVDMHTAGGTECKVESGWFIDPYTGHVVEFLRGPETSVEVHIDHVVALADAWRKGASEWTPSQAQEFANDYLNLLPTQGWVNEEKGALDASEWMPTNRGFWCFYSSQVVLVKHKYDLGVTDAELVALEEGLETCG